jgi:hypothetical protein
MDTSVFTAVTAIAGAVSAVAGLTKAISESPFFKKLGFQVTYCL